MTEKSKARILGEVSFMVATGNLRPIQPTAATNLAEPNDQPDTPDLLTDQSLQKAQPFVDDWLTQVKDLMGRSSSLEEVRDSLFEMYGEMSGDRMAAAMGQALTLAELAGRYEVLQEGDAADLSEPVDFARVTTPHTNASRIVWASPNSEE